MITLFKMNHKNIKLFQNYNKQQLITRLKVTFLGDFTLDIYYNPITVLYNKRLEHSYIKKHGSLVIFTDLQSQVYFDNNLNHAKQVVHFCFEVSDENHSSAIITKFD